MIMAGGAERGELTGFMATYCLSRTLMTISGVLAYCSRYYQRTSVGGCSEELLLIL